jgi:hypothetical protein
MYTKSQQEINECIQFQKKVCQEKGWLHFAPWDGVCFCCNKNIYQNYEFAGMKSQGYSGKEPITGCPHCSRTYTD